MAFSPDLGFRRLGHGSRTPQPAVVSLGSTSAILAARVNLDGRAVSRSIGYQEELHPPGFLGRRAGHDAHETPRSALPGTGGGRQKWRKSRLGPDLAVAAPPRRSCTVPAA